MLQVNMPDLQAGDLGPLQSLIYDQREDGSVPVSSLRFLIHAVLNGSLDLVALEPVAGFSFRQWHARDFADLKIAFRTDQAGSEAFAHDTRIPLRILFTLVACRAATSRSRILSTSPAVISSQEIESGSGAFNISATVCKLRRIVFCDDRASGPRYLADKLKPVTDQNSPPAFPPRPHFSVIPI